MNEDLAWLRVQDMQREAENRRLMSGASSSRTVSAIGRLIVRTIANVRSREAATQTVARRTVKTQHHA
ncbi:MAG TPA: hypothetical protein VIP78_09285 [Candidatus Dormibacteraeota bacterium]|jgi:hypothetical protein